MESELNWIHGSNSNINRRTGTRNRIQNKPAKVNRALRNPAIRKTYNFWK